MSRPAPTSLRPSERYSIEPRKTSPAVGEHDLPVIVGHAQAWRVRQPHAELCVISDAGHCANMDNPKIFNAVLRRFLARSEGEGS